MYFKKLELVGFKSFYNKTILHFEPGITAVVGPNGCGKSNIFDSIRWVLGEQSVKSLRGSDMQDVIFNGTDVKEPLSMAEVTLTFDNESRFFNFDHDEMAITRRIFRSGESEYLLNKAQVRLKDILDLLMGTGVGAESYSLVAQGKIDLVLSSRPEDRRLVFDEASGITKYKAQKRETLRKLEETEQNLLRINDIIAEVKRQIASLERQANKARKYKEVFEELKLKEINLSLLQKREFLSQKDRIITQLRELEEKESGFLVLIKEEEVKVSNRQVELKAQEDNMMSLKNQILNLENMIIRNNEHMSFNKERIIELTKTKEHLETQIEQAKNKLILDEEKENNMQKEYSDIKQNIAVKSQLLTEKETQINHLASSIKNSLEIIAKSKGGILELVTKLANTKNELSDFGARQQVFLARKNRLEIEKAKVFEEKAITEGQLNKITQELEGIKKEIESLNLQITALNSELEKEKLSLDAVNSDIAHTERDKLTLESHKEFLEKLKTKYQDLGEAMNAIIYLDKIPADNVSGLVIKIKDYINLSDEDKAYFAPANFKLSGEAKPVELNTQKIEEKIKKFQEDLSKLKDKKGANEARIAELNKAFSGVRDELRNKEIAFANKETSHQAILEQFGKIKEEEDIIVMELQDIVKEITVVEKNLEVSGALVSQLNKEQRNLEDLILQEENKISGNSKLREGVLVVITQTKTELEALNKRVASEEAAVKLLEDTYKFDKENLINIETQIKDAQAKRESMEQEIIDCENNINLFRQDTQKQNALLKDAQDKYRAVSSGATEVVAKIESNRKALDAIKNELYELQMQAKDIDYKYESIKTRMLEAYKADLETAGDVAGGINADQVTQEIENLKNKIDSLGSVNLVAIEEYDELKKRYDFLIQQQNDLVSAKESLHQAILKINRTTKQMFLETFAKVKDEFKNYFRLLFNGGDAQLFLIDEEDPLESGIEIICRPPGKKLQNVLLLSGGEKSLSAIALIFAVFKVKPSPFCILDEIDAALDEANVDRFSRLLQDFVGTSQFIVITHNKRTIVNANVMYGITMEESGVSKIVSVKFSKDAPEEDKELDVASLEPA